MHILCAQEVKACQFDTNTEPDPRLLVEVTSTVPVQNTSEKYFEIITFD